MKLTRVLLLLILPIYLISCGTQHGIPNYLENLKDSSGISNVKITELIIQKNDQLSIQVYSLSTDPKADQLYNLVVNQTGNLQSSQASGFLVDANGNIEYPRLGIFHVEGLTKQDLAMQIKKRLTEPVELLKDPSVIIRFLNFKITMLGEVGNIGSLNVPGEKLNILEAISLAGGIPNQGKRSNVKIIREVNGKREIGEVDLTSKDVFNSPYFNLVQNDIVYVEPTRRKISQEEQTALLQKVSFAFTLVTIAATLANIFIKN